MSSENNSLPSPDEFVARTFGEGGYLAQRFIGYRPRSGQLALATAISDAIGVGDHLLAEGACGVGKSIAYLVPATYYTSRNTPQSPDAEAPSSARAIVVTGNIALSEQLITKDLPMLRQILPWPFTFGLMKGRQNFVCPDAVYETTAKGLDFQPTAEEFQQYDAIRALAQVFARGSAAGDVSELPFVPSPRLWRLLSVSAEECKGDSCSFYKECPANKANATARKANIIVTNYHMLCAHLQLRRTTGLDLVLPACDTVIADEVHTLPDTARGFFGFTITRDTVLRTALKLRRTEAFVVQQLQLAAGDFFQKLFDLKQSNKYQTRIKEPLTSDQALVGSWCGLEKGMLDVEAALAALVARMEARGKDLTREEQSVLKQHSRSITRSQEIRTSIHAAMGLVDEDNHVYFIDTDHKQRVQLMGKPISVGPILQRELFAETPVIIATSATMCVAGQFDFIADEIGCPASAKLVVGSPFDWGTKAMLVLPDMPEPNSPEFREAVARAVGETIRQASGRTLGLFTSYGMLDYVHAYLRTHDLGYTLLKQGDMSRIKLLDTFRSDVSSVLLGTESFWTGVDVQGPALSAVVIDRLPFPTPDDPIADAMAKRHPKTWFKRYSIPKAVIRLRQGFGRLIRSVDDVGAAVILDPRLISKPYGKLFLRSLPAGLIVRRDIRAIHAFLDRRMPSDFTQDEIEQAFT